MSSTDTEAPAPVAVQEESIEVRGRRSRVFRGGRGPALLLIHGGWGGAQDHWGPVLAPLAATYEVIAPDLPGLAGPGDPALRSVDDYAEWLVALLDALGVAQAAVVGNSFGAAVAWSLGRRHPERCEALVLVNGLPMPATPPLLSWLGHVGPARALLGRLVERLAYSPGALRDAFADPAHAPEALRRTLASPPPALIARVVDALVLGGSPGAPPCARTLVLWGAADRLQRTTADDTVRLHRAVPGSDLVLIARAGHLPQRERPEAFAAALRTFLDAAART